MQYHTGGILFDSETYVTRSADDDLFDSVMNGDFCYVFNARQMGKSSLRAQVMRRLNQENFACASIEATEIGSSEVTTQSWFSSCAGILTNRFNIGDNFDLHCWWMERKEIYSATIIFKEFLEEILLKEIKENVVIFLDEIDYLLKFDFRDDVFALIRSCHNSRADKPQFKRLSFVLIGVATPSQLIQNTTQTPFNIATEIELKEFCFDDNIMVLLEGLREKAVRPEIVLKEILHWTGGQPFLTQKVCKLAQVEPGEQVEFGNEVNWVEKLVLERVIQNWDKQDDYSHLKTIQDRLLGDEVRSIYLLGIIQEVLQNKNIKTINDIDERELLLSGLLFKKDGLLKIRNPIYSAVFNQAWVIQHLSEFRPYATSFNAWLDSECKDDSRLLRGKALEDAQEWASSKSLSKKDQDFLSKCRDFQHNEKLKKILIRNAKNLLFLGLFIIGILIALLITVNHGAGIAEENLDLLTEKLSNTGSSKTSLHTFIDSVKLGHRIEDGQIKKDSELAKKLNIHLNNAVYGVMEKNQFKHDGIVNAVSFSANKELIGTASDDKFGRIWSINGKLINELPHESEVVDIEFNPKKDLIATASKNNFISLWNQNGTSIAALEYKEKNGKNRKITFTNVRFSKDGKLIAASTSNYKIIVWKTDNLGEIWKVVDGNVWNRKTIQDYDFNDISFSNNGKYILACSTDHTIKIVDLYSKDKESFESPRVLEGHTDWVYTAKTNLDDQYIVSSGGGSDRTIKVWRLEDGILLKTIRNAHEDLIHVEWSPDDKYIASFSKDESIKLWDANSLLNSPLTVFNHEDHRFIVFKEIKGLPALINCKLSFGSSGQFAVADNKMMSLWTYLPILTRSVEASKFQILKTSFSHNGSIIATAGSDNIIRLWNENNENPKLLNKHNDWIFDISFSSDDRFIASASEDGNVMIWDVKSGKLLKTLKHITKVYDVAYSPVDTEILATYGSDDYLRIWNTKSKKITDNKKIENSFYLSRSIHFSPDKKFLAINSKIGIQIFKVNVHKHEMKLSLFKIIRDEDNEQRFKILFSPDSKMIAATSANNTLKIWDINTKKTQILKGHTNWISDFKFSPINGIIATASRDETVKLWDKNGLLIRTLDDHSTPVTALDFSPDGKKLISADNNGILKFWDMTKIEPIALDSTQLLDKSCKFLEDYLNSDNPDVTNDDRALCNIPPRQSVANTK
jgi:WD40 repeat protein